MSGASPGGDVVAPLLGTVVCVRVAPGDRVAADDQNRIAQDLAAKRGRDSCFDLVE